MWRRLAVTVVLISVIVIFVSMAGKRMIENSEVFAIAQREISTRFGSEGGTPTLTMLGSYQFSEGLISGQANFTLTRNKRCYPVEAKKGFGNWTVSVAGEFKC
jgi:hypothetical protein